ncbi:MAG: ABC transporter ATP-binding protein [Candidatus Peregrinibacteria bacterium]|nr:ABC transporter ATP-binding protein [Candidatus Peregrinibacteria bacterium]
MKKTTQLTARFYLKHLKYFKWRTGISVTSITIAIILGMAWPILMKYFVDAMVEGGDVEMVVPELFRLLFIMLALDFVVTTAWRVNHYSIVIVEAKGMQRIMNECFQSLHKHSYDFFNSNFSGSLVKKIGRISRAFEGVVDGVLFELYPIALRVMVVTGVLFYLNFWLGLPLLIWTIIFLSFNYFVSLYKLKRYDVPKTKADSKVTARLADSISNHMNIKLFSTRHYERKTFNQVTNTWYRRTKESWFFDSHIEAFQGLLMVGLNFLVLYISINLWEAGRLSVGDFVLIQGFLMELFRQLWDFGRTIRRLYSNLADAEEMTEILNTPIGIKDKPSAEPIHIRHGKIEFKNVKFSYEESTGVIRDFSFKLNPSEKVALIGPSGGGKSTITKLMLRLFDLKGGQILIDGQDISKVTQDSLREQIALVPQDPILFHRTLAENISYGRLDAPMEEVIAASKLAHCHEFISQFPKGYDTFVGERGVKLSGGERQRIAIARAILSNTKILLLDEATSSLDSESEKLIQSALKNLMKNKTTLVIAHRLSTIVSMDRILVLDDGNVAEQGSHAQLIRQKDSLYKKFWDLQVGGYL